MLRHLFSLLLRHTRDFDIRNDKGETPLLRAVQAGNEEAVDQLLQAGADPSASSTAGPEGEARRQLELEIHESHRIRLQSQGRAEEIYIRRNYNVGRYKERFKKPLHFAVQKGHRNIVKLLINAGVDVSATTYHKKTALHYAVTGKRASMFLPKIILGRQRPATRSHLRLIPLRRIQENVSVSVPQTSLSRISFRASFP